MIQRGLDADLRRAIHILDEYIEHAKERHHVHFRIEFLAIRARALDAQGKRGEALVDLKEALELGQVGGYVRAFIDQGPPLRELLSLLAGESRLTLYISRILAAFPKQISAPAHLRKGAPPGATSTPDDIALVEHLTRRELEILALLREPMSQKEIAHRLYLSPATVKRHTITIYAKLGVNSRWDAVAKAIKLGILPPR